MTEQTCFVHSGATEDALEALATFRASAYRQEDWDAVNAIEDAMGVLIAEIGDPND